MTHLRNLIDFWKILNNRGEAVWKDGAGTLDVVIAKNVVSLVQQRSQYLVIAEDHRFLDHLRIDTSSYSHDVKQVISIGSNSAHNKAKQLCLVKGYALVTIPVPLSNDSFCTNRYTDFNIEGCSLPCHFPREVIIDLSLLGLVPPETNLLGLGEYLGSYCSVLDYYTVRHLPIPDELVSFLANSFQDAFRLQARDYQQYLYRIATLLIFKCLMMRTSMDYQVGCGIDHMLGKAFESLFNMAHGRAVFWGCLVALALFPEWEAYGISCNGLITGGRKLRWIQDTDIDLLSRMELENLVKLAIEARPGRPSILREMTRERIVSAEVNLWAALT